MRKTKEEKLEHYAKREMVNFIQFDVFTEHFDDVVKPDEDGYSLWMTQTQELMTGMSTIRVLFRPDMEKEMAIRGLEKMIECIKNDPGCLQWDKKQMRYTESELKEIMKKKEAEKNEQTSGSLYRG